MKKVYFPSMLLAALVSLSSNVAFAEGAADMNMYLPIGAGLAIGIAVLGAALGMGKLVSSMLDSVGRNPSAAGKMTLFFFVGLALIESLGILGFVIANALMKLIK